MMRHAISPRLAMSRRPMAGGAGGRCDADDGPVLVAYAPTLIELAAFRHHAW
jgi:hypothetical protein